MLLEKKYKPMLGNNKPFSLNEIRYPTAVSIKRDGIRGIIKNNELISRELKLIPNKQIQECAKNTIMQIIPTNCILDTELYIHGIPFNEHSIFIMTYDLYSRSHINKIKLLLRKQELTNNYYFYSSLPDNFKFHIFDYVNLNKGYCDRIDYLKSLIHPHERYEIVDYKLCYNPDEVLTEFNNALSNNYEGLVLRKPDGLYKFGRATLREETFLKLKPIESLIGSCIGFTERMSNTNESFTNKLGLLTKRNTVDDKQETGIAATVILNYNGNELKVTLTGTEEYRRYIWEHQSKFIGKSVQFKGMIYGSKNIPRHPVFIKFIT